MGKSFKLREPQMLICKRRVMTHALPSTKGCRVIV